MKKNVRGDDKGAAAIEMALVLPILIMLVFGIVEFGRTYNARIELSGAAREATRIMVVRQGSPSAASDATATARQAAPTVCISATDTTCSVTPSVASCPPGGNISVTVARNWTVTVPLVFTRSFTISGTAVMRCSG